MRLAMFALAVLDLSGTRVRADWPRFRGPGGDGHVPAGVTLPTALAATPNVIWARPVGFGSGSVAAAGQTAYLLDNRDGKEVAVAVSMKDGNEIWASPLDDLWGDSGSPPGPRSTPTIDGERVYVLSCRGEFRCLSARDGKQIWRVNFVKDFGAMPLEESGDIPGAARHGNTGAPLILGNRMYMAVGGRPGAGIICFNKITGDVIWKSADAIPGHAGPVLAVLGGRRQLVCFMADSVMGLDPADGKPLWRVPVETRLGRHVTTPVVVGDTIVVGTYTLGLIGIRVTRGSEGLVAKEVWRDRSLGVDFSDIVSVGTHVCGLGPGGRLFFVEAATGRRAWVQEGFFAGMLDAGFASFIAAGRNMLILAERGQLMLVSVSPAGCSVIGKTTVCGRNWCNPAYVRGRLLVRDAKELRCIELTR